MELRRDKIYLFDGSFSAELAKEPFNSDEHPLWTSGCNNEQMKNAYTRFREIGCDIVTTNTYHASQILARTYDRRERTHVQDYVEVPCRIAKKVFNNGQIILGSIGPYGTSLRDASEYTGNYVDDPQHYQKISAYQQEQCTLLLKNGVNCLLYETVPAFAEAKLLVETLAKLDTKAIVSFSCKDSVTIRHGEPIVEVIEYMTNCDRIVGVGINCTHPNNISDILRRINAVHIKVPVFVYPNSGEWEARNEGKTIHLRKEPIGCDFWKQKTLEWIELGANVIGGCCGVDTEILKIMKESIDEKNSEKGLD